ncbi:MAG TPA: tryptophan 2,3-dioxygenase family protein [Candidatus Dormibacteraeota bacterium]|nr:tryptophan 2,3-dioxygenase family protein [Candidatus Dormibacteraeota bacterium]
MQLDQLLALQRPRSEPPEHDEMLFIIVHQVYELWFKEILHELKFLQRSLESGHTAHALGTLKRILTILKTVVAQVDVLETLTPTQFLTFRSRLDSASGFESVQFRALEAALGVHGKSTQGTTVFDSYLRYLSTAGYKVPEERSSAATQEVLLAVYKDDGEAAQVAERLVDLDEGFQEWRYRHVKMVERTIGDKPGTGGSSGAAYLRETLFQPAFPDLWAIRGRL